MRDFARFKMIVGVLAVLALLLTACAALTPEITSSSLLPASPTPMPTEEALVALEGVEVEEESGFLLVWEDRILLEEAEGCHRLMITTDRQAVYGPCDAAPTTAAFEAPQWEEMVARFAPFEYQEGETRLQFEGRGTIADPAWQRALATWSETTYRELVTGQACPACPTILAWNFGVVEGQPDTCSLLWATDYGYAYVGHLPCAGGQTEVIAQGWLETQEWTQLEGWLRTRAPLFVGEDGSTYFMGQGAEPLAVEELAAWAESVRARMAP